MGHTSEPNCEYYLLFLILAFAIVWKLASPSNINVIMQIAADASVLGPGYHPSFAFIIYLFIFSNKKPYVNTRKVSPFGTAHQETYNLGGGGESSPQASPNQDRNHLHFLFQSAMMWREVLGHSCLLVNLQARGKIHNQSKSNPSNENNLPLYANVENWWGAGVPTELTPSNHKTRKFTFSPEKEFWCKLQMLLKRIS